MSVGEHIVGSNLVAARVLNVLDGQNHYQNTLTAEVSDRGLEIIIAEARGPFHPNTAAVMQQANQAAQAQFNAAMQPAQHRRQQIGHFLGLIEQVMTGPADQTAYGQIQQHLNGLRRVGAVDVSINYAAVRADNTRLRHEAMQLAGQGESAADLVVQYLDEALQLATTTRGLGPFRRSVSVTGIERNVRDYFFIHNLLRGGEGWGYVMRESGWLLLDGGKDREALGELLTAVHLGYNDPAVKLGIAKAREGLHELDGAIDAYNAVLEDMPVDQEANAALARLYGQKAAQTRRSVEGLIVPHDDLSSARSMLTADSIEAANISNGQKASQLYVLAVAYLCTVPKHVDSAIELLQRSLAIEPRKETLSWLGEAHSRLA
ncbi:hypothetical protein HYV85_01345 [Candidatus Woesearchaeota archaeon]|nr:hypothetical protein [Candidatus Woesearchaeota archaeon]